MQFFSKDNCTTLRNIVIFWAVLDIFPSDMWPYTKLFHWSLNLSRALAPIYILGYSFWNPHTPCGRKAYDCGNSPSWTECTNYCLCIISSALTGGNWQKWKRVFLTCPCHEIYRDEAVGLKSCKNTWKITIFVKMWNLGQYRENLIFCQ